MAKGKCSFQGLQETLGEGGDRNQIVAYAFDLLHLNDEDLTRRPLRGRKQMLEALLGKQKNTNAPQKTGALRYSGHLDGSGQEVFTQCCRMGLEGIVSKLVDAPYQAGRQKSWLKVKCGRRQEFIILGYSDPRVKGAITASRMTTFAAPKTTISGISEKKSEPQVAITYATARAV